MDERQYSSLFASLLEIEEVLQLWKCPRIVLFLDAPAEVLRQRVLQRFGNLRPPEVEWFERLRARFVEIRNLFPNAVTASTVDLSPEQVIARARSLLAVGSENSEA